MKHIRLIAIASMLVALPNLLCADAATNMYAAMMPCAEDYTLLWWAEGPPKIMNSKLPHGDETLCFQSGRWGLGYVPVTFTGLSSPKGYTLLVDEKQINQNMHGNDFWQTDYDPASQRWQQTFNITLPAGQPHTVRFAVASTKQDDRMNAK